MDPQRSEDIHHTPPSAARQTNTAMDRRTDNVAVTEDAAKCPVCEAPVMAGDTYCEACGHMLNAPSCASCGASAVDTDGYCERCGLRQPTGRDHAEIVLDGRAAAVTDRGLRRSRNEDAMALLVAGDAVVTVVCDGVGSSPRADEASATAVETAAAALARGLPQEEAFDLAARAVAKLATSVHDAPASTYIAAVVEHGRITLGWAGDTRAYWLPERGPAIRHGDGSAAERGHPSQPSERSSAMRRCS
jgi:hypothetical protein